MDGTQAEDIRSLPSYKCNAYILRFGVLGCAVSALFVLNYPAPQNLYLATCFSLLSLWFWVADRYLLPNVKSVVALDAFVVCYCSLILVAQLVALWCFPEAEVSTGVGCMVVVSALLYRSTLTLVVYIFVTVSSWFLLKWALTELPSPNESLQLLVVAPLIALAARQATVQTLDALHSARLRELDNVLKLRAALEKLHAETDLRERTEAHLQRAQKNEGLGMMAAGVAHDFNNTLSAINAFAELIGLISVDKTIRGHANEIVTAVVHASAVCREMLTYAGKSASQRSAVNLIELVNNLRPLMQASCGCRVLVKIRTDVPSALVSCNAAQIQQALLNLVKNGADAIFGEGSIEIALSRHASTAEIAANSHYSIIRPEQNGACFSLSVADSGSGMGPETIRQMFDPYFTTKGMGHGFGLSNVMGIAKSHEASLAVHSKLGQGTLVSICFTSIEGEDLAGVTSVATAERQMRSQWNAKVLLVDDDDMVRDSIAEVLVFQGWDVIKAASGPSAVSEVRLANDFAVLIIDFNMPTMNGSETLRQIRELGCTTPAILCSGHISSPLQASVLEEFQGFLAKPFHRLELEKLLLRVTGELGDAGESR
jgi:signal transduction histidine kinase/ActR/RegA family two-component response regulator